MSPADFGADCAADFRTQPTPLPLSPRCCLAFDSTLHASVSHWILGKQHNKQNSHGTEFSCPSQKRLTPLCTAGFSAAPEDAAAAAAPAGAAGSDKAGGPRRASSPLARADTAVCGAASSSTAPTPPTALVESELAGSTAFLCTADIFAS